MLQDQKIPRLSIVAACRNEREHVHEFLASLLDQDLRDREWEAVIADGMSDDGTFEILEEFASRHPRIRVIRNPGRIASTGLNAAIRISTGHIVMRLDIHTRYAADYCLRCVETLEATGAGNVGGAARALGAGAIGRAIAAAYRSPFSTGGARFHQEDYEGPVDTVPYGCWRRSTLERIGGFDAELVRNQDDEHNLRLQRAGEKIWQSRSIRSWYIPRSSLRSLFRQYFQYGFWKVAVLRKHRLPASWRHLVPALCLLLAFAALAGATLGFEACALLSAVMLLAYGALLLVASLLAAHESGWTLIWYLPVVFATFHTAYGTGFLVGLIWFTGRTAREIPSDSLFDSLSR